LAKEDAIEVEGKVVEPLPNAMLEWNFDNGHKVLGMSLVKCGIGNFYNVFFTQGE